MHKSVNYKSQFHYCSDGMLLCRMLLSRGLSRALSQTLCNLNKEKKKSAPNNGSLFVRKYFLMFRNKTFNIISKAIKAASVGVSDTDDCTGGSKERLNAR